MNLSYLDNDMYKDIPLLKMIDNKHGGLPFYIRKYSSEQLTRYIHRHEYMQINYIYQGKGKHFINNNEFDIIKGDIFIIPPFIPHYIASSTDSDIKIFEFEFEPRFINQNFESIENVEAFFDFAYIEPFLVAENKVKPRLNLIGKIQVEVENILIEVLMEYQEKKSGYMLLIKSLLLKLLVIIGREFTKDLENSASRTIFDRHRDIVFNAINYIERNFTNEISIEGISQMHAISQSYFSYLFKSITSKTLVAYINSLRISKAMELLKNSDKRIIDICFETGFNNVNHFNRLFKQYTGFSPKTYRNNF